MMYPTPIPSHVKQNNQEHARLCDLVSRNKMCYMRSWVQITSYYNKMNNELLNPIFAMLAHSLISVNYAEDTML
jgi:hypothetical protein